MNIRYVFSTIVFTSMVIMGLFQTTLANPKQSPVPLVGSDDITVEFPYYITAISPTVKSKLVIGDLKFYNYTSQELEVIKQAVMLLPNAARNDVGQVVKPMDINDQTIFVHSLVNDALREWVNNLTNQELSRLLSIADFMNIKPLIDAFSYFIAQRLDIPQEMDLQSNESVSIVQQYLESNGFHLGLQELLFLIRKDLVLKRLGVEERTIADWIGLYGQPVNFDFYEKRLTSLQGIDRISNPEQVTKLNFDNNFILGSNIDPDFPAQAFILFSNIKNIDLSRNQLTTLPQGVFHDLAHLHSLSLDKNQLTTLPEELFQGLPSLQSLILSHNQLTTLPEGVFRGLTRLQWFNLSHNQLTTLPVGVFRGLPSLLNLYLSNNQFIALPEGIFQGLTRLQWLDLTHNQLTKLPERIFQGLNSLEQLTLSFNQLTTLHEGVFQGLISVRVLSLSLNQLATLPKDVFQGLPRLQSLYLYNNRLIQSEEEFKATHWFQAGLLIYEPQRKVKQTSSDNCPMEGESIHYR